MYLHIQANNYATSKASSILYVDCKGKGDGMNQNTFHCCYGDCVTTSQKT